MDALSKHTLDRKLFINDLQRLIQPSHVPSARPGGVLCLCAGWSLNREEKILKKVCATKIHNCKIQSSLIWTLWKINISKKYKIFMYY